jgi:protein gp37
MEYERKPLDKIIGRYGIASIHPAADLLPLMSDDEFQSLCTDVKEYGFLHPVSVNANRALLDGRNRVQVAAALRAEPSIRIIDPPDELAYVFSENVSRRHLTPGQRAIIAEKLANMPSGGDRRSTSGNPLMITREQAAERIGTTPHAITQIRTIKEWAPAAIEEIAAGKINLEAGFELARANKKTKEVIEKPEKTGPKPKIITLAGIIGKKLVEVPYPQPQGKHQFNRTNDAVDWAGYTWNPVTGCNHGCKYCYAREMAYRDSYKTAYPIQFAPLFHHERLDDPINTIPGNDRPQDGRVFVCSMADLFGEWVPQEWIDKVFDAALAAPEWEYLFLTKFPQRYRRINLPPKAWFGASVDIQKRVKVTEKAMPLLDVAVRWISVEPMLEPIKFNDLSWCDLVVIGAQSETMQPDGHVPAFAPNLEWVTDLIAQARSFNVPVYLKPNLLGELTGSKPGMLLPQEQPRRTRLVNNS